MNNDEKAFRRCVRVRDHWKSIGGNAAIFADKLTVVLECGGEDGLGGDHPRDALHRCEQVCADWATPLGPATRSWADQLNHAIEGTGPFAEGGFLYQAEEEEEREERRRRLDIAAMLTDPKYRAPTIGEADGDEPEAVASESDKRDQEQNAAALHKLREEALLRCVVVRDYWVEGLLPHEPAAADRATQLTQALQSLGPFVEGGILHSDDPFVRCDRLCDLWFSFGGSSLVWGVRLSNAIHGIGPFCQGEHLHLKDDDPRRKPADLECPS